MRTAGAYGTDLNHTWGIMQTIGIEFHKKVLQGTRLEKRRRLKATIQMMFERGLLELGNLEHADYVPASNDCLYLQDNGVHFSELGKRFTAIEVAAHLMPYL